MDSAFRRDDRPIVVPRIITTNVAEQAAFIARVFGASGEVQLERPTELRIGDSLVMVSDGGDVLEPMPTFLYVYVPDTDDAFARAVSLGAAPLAPPEMMPFGDRRATVRDPWGNMWQIATRIAPS